MIDTLTLNPSTGTSTEILDSSSGPCEDPLEIRISSDEEGEEVNEGKIKQSNPEIIEYINID